MAEEILSEKEGGDYMKKYEMNVLSQLIYYILVIVSFGGVYFMKLIIEKAIVDAFNAEK